MSVKELERELEALGDLGAEWMVYGEASYPSLLREVSDPPPVLTLWGHNHLLQKEMVGIVGARYSTAVGDKLAYGMGRDFSEGGYVVVSGLARGIDAKAHEGSLQKGTVGVMGSGFHHMYPEENKKLFEQIKDVGLLVSEHSPWVGVQGKLFPRRNRIIAGLSRGVVVIEGSIKSGSLITAQMALDYDREVFAVPGSPLDGRSKGCHKLIKEGAHLVESAFDVMEVLKGYEGGVLKMGSREMTFRFSFGDEEIREEEEDVLERLREELMVKVSYVPVLVDDLIGGLVYSPRVCLSVLADLELAGKVRIESGGYVLLNEEAEK
jgi:DNA processing protein